jgi:hypothetical protein
MTLQEFYNPQLRSNTPHNNSRIISKRRTLVQNKINNSQGSSTCIIDETLTSHLDACARASKVRERVPLLYPPLNNNSKETILHELHELGNTCTTKKKSMTTSVHNFDKDRFQKLMTKRRSLAQMQANLCSKSWNVQNIENMERAKATGNRPLYKILYSKCCDNAFKFIREESKKTGERVLFLSGDYDWSVKTFKGDALYVLLPSQELFETIISDIEDPEERRQIKEERERYIAKLSYSSIRTYNSFVELEGLIRNRFTDLQHTV